ncbi:fasciclin domain-containing protein [Tenacibaculum sp. UWU-22]|uniref:fasciclin domain-containing protein n=1 Tax=Tenacibaculum sp. UWU-22 TaxID=3234187 RepID=UPI0034DADC99
MRKLHLILISVSILFLTSCKQQQEKKQTQNVTKTEVNQENQKGQSAVVDNVSEKNALQIAESVDDFKTLVTAIKAAGVEDAVVNAGPLTIFAPKNSAFAKLPEGTVENLLKPENKAKLAYILINHVAPANYPIKQLTKEAKKGRKLYMASGKYLTVEKKEDGIYVGGTKILKTVEVSNGWIHVIDDVLVPEN